MLAHRSIVIAKNIKSYYLMIPYDELHLFPNSAYNKHFLWWIFFRDFSTR